MKAKLAITLGKTYRQEGSLQWGYLTPPDDVRSEHVKLTQRSGPPGGAAVTVLVERLDPVPDPADAAVRLSHLPWLIWLDSADGPEAPGPLEHHVGPSVEDAPGASARVTEQRNAHEKAWSVLPGDMLQVLERELAPLQIEPRPGRSRRSPAAPWGSSDTTGAACSSGARPRAMTTWPCPARCSGCMTGPSSWDHEAGACWIVSTGLPATGDERARVAQERIEQVRTALARQTRRQHRTYVHRRDTARARARAVLSRARPGERGGDRAPLHVHRTRIPERGAAGARVHPGRRHLPGQPVAALRGAAARRHRWRSTSGFGARIRPPFGAYLACDDVTVLSVSPERFLLARWRPGRDPADQGHAPARTRPDARPGARPRAHREREGPRRERDDRGPAAERPLAGLPPGQRARARALHARAASRPCITSSRPWWASSCPG